MGTRLIRLGAAATLATGALIAGVQAPGQAAYTWSSQLTRYPWLTDTTSTGAQLSWASSVSGTGTATWGPAGSCTGSRATATRVTITVNGVTEYQYAAKLTGLSPSTTYCYRVSVGSTDLLGSDASPAFTTLAAAGNTSAVTFAVMGDWGDTTTNGVDPGDTSNGVNPDQAKVMAQIAGSGAQFVVSAGDVGYQSGSDTNYGDLYQTGTDVSAVFAPTFYKRIGATIPMFAAMGNHGLNKTVLQNWPEGATAAASGGVYGMVSYPSIDGAKAATYPSNWYAVQDANVRIYVLDAAWGNSNVPSGTTMYQLDHDAHWTVSSAEYKWLAADLAAHPGVMKFAVFHFPLHSDNATESTDTWLDGPSNLEGLLSSYDVAVTFNGHAHMYQRNTPQPGLGRMRSYVTGGGGAKLEPIGGSGCSATDAYGIGWRYSSASGTKCGAAPLPTSSSQVFHYLLVTVSGTTVTVRPTDENGNAFDVQQYTYPADTQAPTAPTGLTASAASGSEIDLQWAASSDDVGVMSYDVRRDGVLVATVPGTQTSYADTGLAAGTTYGYTVTARDAAGNSSAASNTTTASTSTSTTSAALFSDGFESGDMSAWTTNTGITVQNRVVDNGSWAAEQSSTGAATYAQETITTQNSVYYRAHVYVVSRGSNNVYLMKLRTGGSTNSSILGLYLNTSGALCLRNDAGSQSVSSTATVSSGSWHSVEVHATINGTSSSTEVWLDGVKIAALSLPTANLGTASIGRVQLGDNSGSRTYDVAFDDVVVDTAYVTG